MGDVIDMKSRRKAPTDVLISAKEPSERILATTIDAKLAKVRATIERINDLCKSLNEKR